MSKEKLLIVEDETDILELICFNLEKDGYQVKTASTGESALKIAQEESLDLILLDLMLPGIDGLEVTKKLKNNNNTENIPIIMLTAKGEEADIVTGLEIGADDYITKPFSPRILIARIRAVLRRKVTEEVDEQALLKIHDIVIDPGKRQVFVKDQPIDLTYTEFQILHVLSKRPGWVFTRYQIVDNVRGVDYPVTERSVDVQIVGLRKKMGKQGEYIETVRGVGYRFAEKP